MRAEFLENWSLGGRLGGLGRCGEVLRFLLKVVFGPRYVKSFFRFKGSTKQNTAEPAEPFEKKNSKSES